MGRIINNLVSNIRKYGDMKQEVCLEFFLFYQIRWEFSITNGIALSDSHINGTGIGLKKCISYDVPDEWMCRNS